MELRAHFGFGSMPFTREIDVRHMFTPSYIVAAVDAMERAVHNRMSACLLGPAGSGKTSSLRALLDRLPEARFRTHYVKVTGLSKRDMCREISTCMALQPAGAYNVLIRRIQESALNAVDVDGVRPVLILDEAQDLRPDVLGMLSPLTNFEMDSRLVLAVVLAGHPRLYQMMRRPELEGVARRFAHYATLRLLSREETVDYVSHRCAVAGCTRPPFDDRSIDAIYEICRGNLRATDSLALKSLEVAAAKGVETVDHMNVIDARRSLWP